MKPVVVCDSALYSLPLLQLMSLSDSLDLRCLLPFVVISEDC